MVQKKNLRDIDVSGKRVLLRSDLNVPFTDDGMEIANANRIVESLPTVRYLVQNNATVVICSHLGRPKGQIIKDFTLLPVATKLEEYLMRPVKFIGESSLEDAKYAVNLLKAGDVLLLENLRFHPGEEKNDPEFCKSLSELADIYVNDAFGSSHRAHASIQGITNYLPSVAGLLLEKEIQFLGLTLSNPSKPFTAILGGGKISDKIKVVEKVVEIADDVLIGGGMAATFIKAMGYEVGKSIVEESYIQKAKDLLAVNSSSFGNLFLPKDVVVADKFSSEAATRVCAISDIKPYEILMDIGPSTVSLFSSIISKSALILWNGPMGVFEMSSFSSGTKAIATSMVNTQAITIIGGGSTVEAVSSIGLEDNMTHVSTGGGASLEFLEGRELPGVTSLMNSSISK